MSSLSGSHNSGSSSSGSHSNNANSFISSTSGVGGGAHNLSSSSSSIMGIVNPPGTPGPGTIFITKKKFFTRYSFQCICIK